MYSILQLWLEIIVSDNVTMFMNVILNFLHVHFFQLPTKTPPKRESLEKKYVDKKLYWATALSQG